jgi:tRNA threonylcarbamoyladenosine biosynthesis protein TsaE
MDLKEVRTWKKVYEQDLGYVAYELKELVSAPAFIMLEGPLGAGKTTFSKVFIKAENTISPTYSILWENDQNLHADFYRIKDREEIIQLELGMYLEDKQFFLAEWSKQHYHSIDPELSDDFTSYLLEITLNDEESEPSRNFILSLVKED